MKLSRLVDRAYGEEPPTFDFPIPLHALAQIYPKFGKRFRLEDAGAPSVQSKPLRPFVDLGIGEYFDCDPEIIRAAIDSLRAGNTRYLILEPLKHAIANAYREEHGVHIDAQEVLLLGGARPGIAIAALAGIDPGDVVIVPDPDYIGLTHMASAVGATLVRVPLKRIAEVGFAPDLDAIKAHAAAGARAILLTNPNNPTGFVWRRGDLETLALISDRFGMLVVVNEIYDRLVFRGNHCSYASIGNLERAVIIGGTAKVYDMTGFGLGWILSSAENVAVFEDLLFLTHQGKPDATSQHAALAALTSPVRERGASNSRARLLVNAQLTVEALDGFCGCRCPLPDAGQFAFPWIGGDDLEVARFLKTNFQVQVVPGSIWGSQGAGHLRVALANDKSRQAEGLERLRAGLMARNQRAV
jgi:aspartate/methionine/tyrosine aminotransferase